MLNASQVAAVVRWALTFVGGIAVTKGYIAPEDLSALTADTLAWIGPTIVLVTFTWGLWRHNRTNTVQAAADLPEVQSITTSDKAIASATSSKVRST